MIPHHYTKEGLREELLIFMHRCEKAAASVATALAGQEFDGIALSTVRSYRRVSLKFLWMKDEAQKLYRSLFDKPYDDSEVEGRAYEAIAIGSGFNEWYEQHECERVAQEVRELRGVWTLSDSGGSLAGAFIAFRSLPPEEREKRMRFGELMKDGLIGFQVDACSCGHVGRIYNFEQWSEFEKHKSDCTKRGEG